MREPHHLRVGITGASGLIGSALRARLLSSGHSVVAFVRSPAGGAGDRAAIRWDPDRGELDPADLSGLDAIVHLAGASIGGHRWSDEYRRTILDSRVRGTTLLSDAIASAGSPGVLLSGSAIGYYGDREEAVDEGDGPGAGFLAEVCVAWEAATASATAAGARVAHLRTGIVLSREGGALKKMLPLFQLGLGGRFGNGRQWMSWISIDDEVGAIEHLLTSSVSGPVNLTAPNPCRNADFAKTLGKVLRRPSLLPVPEFGPKLLLGSELAESLLFDGQRVEPTVLLDDGYEFRHTELESALRAVLAK